MASMLADRPARAARHRASRRRALGLARLGEMMRQDFRLAVAGFAQPVFERSARRSSGSAWRGPRSSVE